MTQQHKHADILIAIAEGKTVQFKSIISGEWVDYPSEEEEWFSPLFCADEYEWRVKPETKKIEIINFIDTHTDRICTFFYKENEFTDGWQNSNLKVLSRSVVKVHPDVYNRYF